MPAGPRLHLVQPLSLGSLKTLATIITLLLVITVPFWGNAYVVRICCQILLYFVLAMSLNVVLGYTGMLSFGHAVFYGIGAYTTALLLVSNKASFLPSLVLSGFLAGAVALAVGVPVIRFKGNWLALVTLGFGQIFWVILQNWSGLTRGPRGIPGIPPARIAGLAFDSPEKLYLLILGLTVIAYVFFKAVEKSYIGRAWLAIREDEHAAQAMGINLTYYKLLAFTIGGFWAGICGSYLTVFMRFIAPSNFTMDQSILMALMVILGGVGSLEGSLLGAAIIVIATQVFTNVTTYQMALVGLLVIVMMLLRPQGILGRGISKGE